MKIFRRFEPLRQDTRGAVAVEFAFVGPILILMMAGIMSWGGYFWMSHSIQQLANDAARAALAGLNSTERESLAKAAVSSGAGQYEQLETKNVSTQVLDDKGRLTVVVAYDASKTFPFALKGLVPLPSDRIQRRASVLLGGY